MMKFYIVFLLALTALPANADTIYQVTGSMSVSANKDFPGVTETIGFSFMLDYLNSPGAPTWVRFMGTPTITSAGPLGTFVAADQSSNLFIPENNYIKFGSGQAEIDLMLTTNIDIFPPIIFYANMYTCGTLLACTEFDPRGAADGANVVGMPNLSLYGPASATVSVVSTPEPATLGLLGIGLLAFAILKKTE
jgi:hypothetical protein